LIANAPITRSLVLLSAAAAFAFQIYLEQRGWPPLSWLAAGYFAAGFAIAGWRPQWAVAVILALGPLAPALTDQISGYRAPGVNPFWLSGLAGVIAAAGRGDWSYPSSWRTPLVYSALVIALGWPIVAGREFGFAWWQLHDPRLITTSVGIPPAVHAEWISDVATVSLFGLLWVDLLLRFSASSLDRNRWLERFAVLPVVAGASLAALAGLYQMTVDIEFLNRTFFGALGRPTGTMIDGNAFGATCALAGALALTAGVRAPDRLSRAAWWSVTALCWAGAWSSASRTAFLVVAITLIGGVIAGIARRQIQRRLRTTGAIAIIMAVLAIALTLIPLSRLGGPFARTFESVSTRAWSRTAATIVSDLVRRDGYGTIGHGMIRDWPVAGVGIGAYHALAVDFSRIYGVQEVRPDNAQNWLRHQLAEFGVLGSLGWILWIAALVSTARRAMRGDQRPAAIALSGGLSGLAAASLLGVPTMNSVVLLTFWVMATWLGVMAGLSPAAEASSRRGWSAIAFVLIAGFLAATVWSALGRLSVPGRAAMAAWPYERGWYDYDNSARPPFRWTRKEAVSVFLPRGRYLRLVFSVQHPDLSERPVDVKVRVFRRTVVRERFRTPQVVTRYVPVSPGSAAMMVSFEVSRTFRAPAPDTRELGIAVTEWSFVNSVPRDGWIVQ